MAVSFQCMTKFTTNKKKIIPFINIGNNICSLSCDTQSLDSKYLSNGYIEKEAYQGYHILKK